MDNRADCDGEHRPYVGVLSNYNVATNTVTPGKLA